jgi:hypothetical protein
MNIIAMPLEIAFIANLMLPVAPLPEALFAFIAA